VEWFLLIRTEYQANRPSIKPNGSRKRVECIGSEAFGLMKAFQMRRSRLLVVL